MECWWVFDGLFEWEGVRMLDPGETTGFTHFKWLRSNKTPPTQEPCVLFLCVLLAYVLCDLCEHVLAQFGCVLYVHSVSSIQGLDRMSPH